jgi:hypothetical protein
MHLREWISRFKHLSGIDRPIAYVISARLTTILGNIGTVILMLRYLTPVEQGYYFTLISLAALQVIFELGFSFVILQLAAHEHAHSQIGRDGQIEWPTSTPARLASILQVAFRWHVRAAAGLGVCLLPLGIAFFSHSQQPGSHVRWFLPWLTSIVACMWLFIESPLFAFLEGCGEVCQVAGMRLCQTTANTIAAWVAISAHRGLFAPGLVMMASALVGSVFLWYRRRFLIELWRYPVGKDGVSWRREILPFQWRIGVSWLCAYFTIQVFTPILFHYRGAAEAGRMGMSISVVGYLSALVLAWMTTKAPPFGRLVARRDFGQLDALFFRTLRQAIFFLVLLVSASMLTVILLNRWFPTLAGRLVSPTAFALLLSATVGGTLAQCMAIYLRSFKRGPLLWQSVSVATMTMLCSWSTVRTMGAMGISLSYFLGTGIIGLFSAVWIFQSWRRTITRSDAFVPSLAVAEQ